MKIRIAQFISVILMLSMVLVFTSCGEDLSDEEILTQNEELLQAYFTSNNLNPQKTASGIYYIIEQPGNDQKPTRSSTITIHYKGYFLSGEEFDSSYSRGGPSQLSLRTTIDGWKEGIPLFGIGGKGSLYIPSTLAYGREGSGSTIPANTPLAFDIELFDFN